MCYKDNPQVYSAEAERKAVARMQKEIGRNDQAKIVSALKGATGKIKMKGLMEEIKKVAGDKFDAKEVESVFVWLCRGGNSEAKGIS